MQGKKERARRGSKRRAGRERKERENKNKARRWLDKNKDPDDP